MIKPICDGMTVSLSRIRAGPLTSEQSLNNLLPNTS
jgi:hypothetical protein